MTMHYRRNPWPDCVAQARALLAVAAEGVEQLESAANQAFCRLAALAGLLARHEKLAESHEPEAAEAAALDAATVCREAEALLHYVRGGWTGPYGWGTKRGGPLQGVERRRRPGEGAAAF
jgi:hypothetical protein